MPLKSWSEMMKDAEETTTGFEPLEVGQSYTFVIEQPAKVGETQKGHPKFTIQATVESGPRKNARHTHHFNGSDSGWAMKKHFFGPIYAIGLSPAFFASEPTPEQIANAFQGKRFVARVEKQKDSDYLQLVDFAPAPGGAAQAGVPTGIPTPQAAPAPQQVAPAQTNPVPEQVAPAVSPAPAAAPANDNNPWASTPPPAPAF